MTDLMRLGLTPVNLHRTGGKAVAAPRRPDRPEPQFQVEDLFNPRRAKFLLWLNTAVKLSVLRLDHEVEALAASRLFGEEMTVRPEDTLRAAGISSERQAKYQRQMSNLLAGRS
jgi:hypothetical protein